jgi:hypothetical protein
MPLNSPCIYGELLGILCDSARSQRSERTPIDGCHLVANFVIGKQPIAVAVHSRIAGHNLSTHTERGV